MAKTPKPTASNPAIKAERQARVRAVRTDDTSEPESPFAEEPGLSLEDLGQAYAALLNRGVVPYEEPGASPPTVEPTADDPILEAAPPEPLPPSDVVCELSPKSILEAMLFVGHPLNEPLTAAQVSSLMRGVLPDEIDELVRELNEQYLAEHCSYEIVSEGPGYRLMLRQEFGPLREQFYGRAKEAKLSQPAVDILAIVAYHQPVNIKEIDRLRGKPSSGILSQLVRRQLVRIDRDPDKPREVAYRTTPRFLDLFNLESLDDLPRSHEFE